MNDRNDIIAAIIAKQLLTKELTAEELHIIQQWRDDHQVNPVLPSELLVTEDVARLITRYIRQEELSAEELAELHNWAVECDEVYREFELITSRPREIAPILAKQLLEQELTAEEQQILADWRAENPAHEAGYHKIVDKSTLAAVYGMLDKSEKKILGELIKKTSKLSSTDDQLNTDSGAHQHQTGTIPPARTRIIRMLSVAATIAIVLSTSYYIFRHDKPVQRPAQTPEHAMTNAKAISPGQASAVLELADGSSINLDSANSNFALNKQGVQINGQAGQLVYQPGQAGSFRLAYNTLRVPAGGEYRLELADHTKIRLNAGSRITFPVAFTEKERIVELEGEAFFDVTKDPGKPFLVRIKGANGRSDVTVRVLGTTFNVNAYPEDQTVTTTLVEGKVNITTGHHSALLAPKQQAIVREAVSDIQVNQHPDMKAAIGWTQDLFVFQDEELRSILKKVARWYKLEITYLNEPPAGGFSGTISRYSSLEKVLELLSASGVRYELDGQRLKIL
ncbi:FecR family protein [Chitinophaga sedimenti]|uniref:FecR family protein n=1 Tax=Chitinophaga sedimenti TaxID=2033606 RepID=UPI002004FE52|nr:FecR domain-containing protein [Chitinophaga sedimenti]MCK7559458.1 FecR family protein [Chitinophaga sedimenti]